MQAASKSDDVIALSDDDGEIEEIDESCYRELPGQHILSAGDAGWNSAGMHHADLYQLDNGRWVAAVDGHQKRWILKFGLP